LVELKATSDPIVAIKQSFSSTDKAIKSSGEKSGSTAAIAFIKYHGEDRILYTANCGDARIVLNRGGKAIRLTKDHKPNDPEEKKELKI